MKTHNAIARSAILLTFTLLSGACRDAFDADHDRVTSNSTTASLVATSGVATPIVIDQREAALNIGVPWGSGGTHVGKQFDQNPHLGDAIVATFVWRGSTNTITTVTDHLEDGTPVGNTYTLVEYVTADGWSMATYVATNVGNFADPAPSPDKVLAVHAIFSDAITDGGEMISAYSGVSPGLSLAFGAHRSAAATASTTTVADPGAISVGAGGLAYAITMANAVTDVADPAGFSMITTAWNATNQIDGEYAVAPAAGTVDPQWTWSFQAPSTWFATALALNPQTATHLGFQVQPSGTLLPGSKIAPAVQVVALDDEGNTVSGFVGSVTIAIAHDGSLMKNAHLSGTRVVTSANGVASFADLSIDQMGMGYTLQATADNLTGVTSRSFNVTVP
jgi:hypothetical protein